jgi:predicted nucleic-acid-binding protein
MKGIDTNVLLRYLLHDDPGQAARAQRYILAAIRGGDRVFINPIVLVEAVWVLESGYGFSRREVAEAIEMVLRTAEFEIDDIDAVWSAHREYQRGQADFADYLICRKNTMAGCAETATFDGALRGTAGFRVL